MSKTLCYMASWILEMLGIVSLTMGMILATAQLVYAQDESNNAASGSCETSYGHCHVVDCTGSCPDKDNCPCE